MVQPRHKWDAGGRRRLPRWWLGPQGRRSRPKRPACRRLSRNAPRKTSRAARQVVDWTADRAVRAVKGSPSYRAGIGNRLPPYIDQHTARLAYSDSGCCTSVGNTEEHKPADPEETQGRVKGDPEEDGLATQGPNQSALSTTSRSLCPRLTASAVQLPSLKRHRPPAPLRQRRFPASPVDHPSFGWT